MVECFMHLGNISCNFIYQGATNSTTIFWEMKLKNCQNVKTESLTFITFWKVGYRTSSLKIIIKEWLDFSMSKLLQQLHISSRFVRLTENVHITHISTFCKCSQTKSKIEYLIIKPIVEGWTNMLDFKPL